ncbi:DUF6191 domain-containing protein [Streptosporangium sp. DT93]|uniref:DUF6191 domain-containing protein n=1 Tax=Streptosporangium sp. DT93 TaxID=3393428 RepID=UPI003CF0FEA9
MTAMATALPALVLLLLAVAVLDRLWRRVTGSDLISWLRGRSGPSLSATGFDEFTAAFHGTKRTELEHRQVRSVLRDDGSDGAPPHDRVDLDRGLVVIRLPGGRGDAAS